MEGDFCSFCGALKVTATRLVCVGKTKKGPGRRNGIRRKRRREIPRATIDVVVCPACKKRDLAERRDRNTPAKWLAYEVALAALCGLLLAPALWVLLIMLQIIVEAIG